MTQRKQRTKRREWKRGKAELGKRILIDAKRTENIPIRSTCLNIKMQVREGHICPDIENEHSKMLER